MPAIDLKHIARLARLRFKEEELKVFESQVTDILRFVEELKKVNVEGVDPTSSSLSQEPRMRPDAVSPSVFPIEAFLSRSPRPRGRFFEVPKVIEDK